MIDGPIIDEGVRVCAQECSTCIFKPGNLMFLRGGRVKDMVDTARADNAAIVCHKTLSGKKAICRGWFSRFGRDTIMGRLAIQKPIEIDPDGEVYE
jgi:hypothetical protein